MSIKDQLTADMKQAMKDREAGKLRLSVIRMVRANIKNVEINDKKELTDDEVLAVLMKEVKMRQDSVEEFQKAGRDELVAQAKEEIAILKKYLPEALSDDELKAIVAEVIAAVGATSPKDMGKVMPAVMAKTKGRADGKRINVMVRELLKEQLITVLREILPRLFYFIGIMGERSVCFSCAGKYTAFLLRHLCRKYPLFCENIFSR